MTTSCYQTLPKIYPAHYCTKQYFLNHTFGLCKKLFGAARKEFKDLKLDHNIEKLCLISKFFIFGDNCKLLFVWV